MNFTNYTQLATTPLRKDALDILSAGIDSALSETFLPQYVQFANNFLTVCGDSYSLESGRLFVIGGGKAAGHMAQALEKIIPLEKISGGCVTSQVNISTHKIEVCEAGFPVPDTRGLKGVQKMLRMTQKLCAEDTVICLISGGGSALMPCPVSEVSLKDTSRMNELLITSGIDHYEINIVRKHLSQTKGGKLARLLQPARVISLILSDDFGGKGDVASGPTTYDSSTFHDAYAILEKYAVIDRIPTSIIDYFQKGMKGEITNKVQKEDSFWKYVHNYTLADNGIALKAMETLAKARGYRVAVIPEVLTGSVEQVAEQVNSLVQKIPQTEKKPYALVFGTEMTLRVNGKGRGGRNQELTARLITSLNTKPYAVLASVDSDGVDFIRGVAGALVDNLTALHAKESGINIKKHIENNDTFHLHERLDTLIQAKPSGTNVGDLHVYLQGKP